MTKTTSIEWCDHTWTPVVGCDPVSPACANCYAATMAARLDAMGQEKYQGVAQRAGGKGKWTGKVTFWKPELVKPLTVRKAARWFVTSMGDIAHDAVTDEQLAEIFGVMAVAGAAGSFHREQDGCKPQKGSDGSVLALWPNMHSGPHTFMVLTKRPARLSTLLLDSRFRKLAAQAAYRWAHNRTDAGAISGGMYPFGDMCDGNAYWPLPNVFVGCTVEDQQRADELRPHMASLSAAGWKTFVSYEPALGMVDWNGWEFLQQLISGGESGPKARPSHPDWHRAARDFAAASGIAYLFKQWGEWIDHDQPGVDMLGTATSPLHSFGECDVSVRLGKRLTGRHLDGRTHDGFPKAA